MIIRKTQRRIHADERWPWWRSHQGSPRSILQCRQGRTSGWGIVYTVCVFVCVFINAVPVAKLFACQCVCVYYCSTYYKTVRVRGGVCVFVYYSSNYYKAVRVGGGG